MFGMEMEMEGEDLNNIGLVMDAASMHRSA